MEDENTKEENQPSTSKKESGHELYDDGRDDRGSNSETSVTASYSARSRIDMADARPEAPKPPTLGKREREPKAPKTRRHRAKRGPGRVEKRRRSFARRHVRRMPRRKHRVKDERKDERRDLSVSTIFTRFSSRSGSRAPGCIHCGHRCCRRRYYYYRARDCRCKPRKYQRRRKIVKKKPAMRVLRTARTSRISGSDLSSLKVVFPPGSEEVQVGSRCAMFSPLFINTTCQLTPGILVERNPYCEVSPQMIYNGLRRLSVWRQHIMTTTLMYYIRSKYPVNPVEGALYGELKEKLRVAAIVGLVVETYEDHWSLSSALQRRHLNINHVTAFWRAYADTLSPIRRKRPEMYQAVFVDKGTTANIQQNETTGHYEDTI